MSVLTKVGYYEHRHRGLMRSDATVALWPEYVVLMPPYEDPDRFLMVYRFRALDEPFDLGTYTSEAGRLRFRLTPELFSVKEHFETLLDAYLSRREATENRLSAVIEIGGREFGTLGTLLNARRRFYNM